MQRMHDIQVIPLERDLDVTYAPQVKLALEQLCSAGCRRIIVNMASAQYIDSAGMGVLVGASRTLRANNGLLSLANISPQVEHALKTARLLDFIPAQYTSGNAAIPELGPAVKPLWRHTINLDGQSVAASRRRLEELLGQLAYSQDELFDFSLACGEAIGNAVDHACASGTLVTVTAYPDRAVVQVSDCGAGFEPTDTELEECCERGRGIKLMRLLADDVQIMPKTPGPGMVVRITKLI